MLTQWHGVRADESEVVQVVLSTGGGLLHRRDGLLGQDAWVRRRGVESGVIPGGSAPRHVRPVGEVGTGHAQRLKDLRAHVVDVGPCAGGRG
jgi:hypothetical protein